MVHPTDAVYTAIYEHYLGESLSLRRKYSSIFRDDGKNKSLTFFRGDDNKIRFKDQGGYGASGDAISFVMEIEGIPFIEAKNLILNQFGDLDLNNVKVPKNPPQIVPDWEIRGGWEQYEIDFWKNHSVPIEQLKKFNNLKIEALRKVKLGRNWTYSKPDNPIFLYLHDNGCWKIYQPYSKDMKWRSGGDLDTLCKIGESKTTIVTGSVKDSLVLSQFVTTTSPMGTETANFVWKNYEGDNNFIFMFDGDFTGFVASVNNAKAVKCKTIVIDMVAYFAKYFPECKDFGELGLKYSEKEVLFLLQIIFQDIKLFKVGKSISISNYPIHRFNMYLLNTEKDEINVPEVLSKLKISVDLHGEIINTLISRKYKIKNNILQWKI